MVTWWNMIRFAKSMKAKKTNEQCVHHWVIDEFNVGRCIKCPAVRDFGALMRKEGILQPARQHSAKRGRKRKE